MNKTLSMNFRHMLALWQGWRFAWVVNIMLAGLSVADVTVNFYKFYRSLQGG